MINLRPEDIYHKSQLNRLLIEIIDNPLLSQNLAFKGGTAAAMLGFLDRFSVDLDFDLLNKANKNELRKEFKKVFNHLDLSIIKEFKDVLFFQVKYVSQKDRQRSTIKISAQDRVLDANEYRVQYLKEIDRLINCQTIETMVANKLVAITDRYDKHKSIAGRDIYDVHYFFLQGYKYRATVIKERTGLDPRSYFTKLITFIDKNVSQTIVNEDLYSILPDTKYQQIRKILIPETKHLVREEIETLAHSC
ncbi:MAG: nucleotidyl transferase AbiEii/AbiGii toxin family protein [Candidatus Saccharimonadales bacterium]